MTVRGARTFSGYQALFCDRLGRADFLGLSAEAKGFLFLLRLWADRSVLVTRNTTDEGKVYDDELQRFWVGADAEAWFCEVHPEMSQDAVAKAMGELVAGSFVLGGYDEEVVVWDFVEDDRRKAGNLRRPVSDERGGVATGFSGEGEAVDASSAREGFGGRSGAPQAPANRRGACPPSSPPPMVREDAHGGGSASVGGKGGVYSENIHYGKQQTPQPSNPNFQTPYQTGRDGRAANANDGDGLRMVGGGEEGGHAEFYAKIHSQNIFSAAEFACRQNDVVFRKAFEKRLNHYPREVVLESLEYVAVQLRDNPQSINRKFWRNGQPIGGPLLWSVMEKFGRSRGVAPYVAPRKVGFQ